MELDPEILDKMIAEEKEKCSVEGKKLTIKPSVEIVSMEEFERRKAMELEKCNNGHVVKQVIDGEAENVYCFECASIFPGNGKMLTQAWNNRQKARRMVKMWEAQGKQVKCLNVGVELSQIQKLLELL